MEPIWLILPVATLPITLLAKLPPLLTEEAYIWPPIPPAAASPKSQEEEEENQPKEDEIHILKIAAKSENRTFLFEPKDIDFVESLNKCNYVSVRGTLFQVSDTMDELERILAKSGFFRCHRSYIANMQRVEEIEKISKNSFALVLRDKEQSRIPLAKGRVAEMKETFGW